MGSPKFHFLCSDVNSVSLRGPQNTYLVIGKDPENMEFRIWSKALALPHAGYHTCHEGAMAQPCRPQGEKFQNTADTGCETQLKKTTNAKDAPSLSPGQRSCAAPERSPSRSPRPGCPDSGPRTPAATAQTGRSVRLHQAALLPPTLLPDIPGQSDKLLPKGT